MLFGQVVRVIMPGIDIFESMICGIENPDEKGNKFIQVGVGMS